MYLAALIPDSHCIAHDDQRVTRLTFHVKHDPNSFRAARLPAHAERPTFESNCVALARQRAVRLRFT